MLAATLATQILVMRMCMLMTFVVCNDLLLFGGYVGRLVCCVDFIICTKLGKNVEETTFFS